MRRGRVRFGRRAISDLRMWTSKSYVFYHSIHTHYVGLRSRLENGNVYFTFASRHLAASFSGLESFVGLSGGMPRMGRRRPEERMMSADSPLELVNATSVTLHSSLSLHSRSSSLTAE